MLKVILAVISLPGYAKHYKYRITFFSIIKRHIRNPSTSENDRYTAARSTSVTFHESTYQTVFIFCKNLFFSILFSIFGEMTETKFKKIASSFHNLRLRIL